MMNTQNLQPIYIATVTEVVEGGVKLHFRGELAPRTKVYSVIGATPSVNDRVAVAAVSGTYVVLGGGAGGSGDVIGPSAATSGNIPVFADATGKILDDSGYAPSSFLPVGGTAANANKVGGWKLYLASVVISVSGTEMNHDFALPAGYFTQKPEGAFAVSATGIKTIGAYAYDYAGNSATLIRLCLYKTDGSAMSGLERLTLFAFGV